MSEIQALLEQLRGQIQQLIVDLKAQIFGENNERLDFLVDSFYKLSAPQRTGVLAGIFAGIGVFMTLFTIFYFVQINSLRNELSKSFEAIHELRELKTEYARIDATYSRLERDLSSATSEFRVKPFLEKIANEQGVLIEGINEQRLDLPSDNPLNSNFQETRVDWRLSNISIPKLLTFLVEVEKSGNYVRIYDLTIKGRFGNRLYFDATTIKAHAYSRK